MNGSSERQLNLFIVQQSFAQDAGNLLEQLATERSFVIDVFSGAPVSDPVKQRQRQASVG
jgi:hypothetical protein